MQSIYDIIVTPKDNKRYNNEKDIDGQKLILNSAIDENDYRYVNRQCIVKKLPAYNIYEWDLKVGDEVVVHHNAIRRYWGFNCDLRDGDGVIGNNEFVLTPEQVFMKKDGDSWKCLWDYCFVTSIKDDRMFTNSKDGLREDVAILKYSNKNLEDKGLNQGDKVLLTPSSNYRFDLDGETLYKISSRDICAILC